MAVPCRPAGVEEIDTETSRGRDNPLADELAITVEIHQRAGYRTDLVEDLLAVFFPGGITHNDHPAGSGIRERGDILSQLQSLSGIIQPVNTSLRIQPAALREAKQISKPPLTQRRPRSHDVLDQHPPSIAASAADRDPDTSRQP